MSDKLMTIPECKLAEIKTRAEWVRMGTKLGHIAEVTPIAIAEWLMLGEDREYMQRGKYDQAAQITGLAAGTLANYVTVYRKTESSHMCEDLNYQQRREIARLEPAQQEPWIKKAIKNDMTGKQLREAIQEKQDKTPAVLPEPESPLVTGCRILFDFATHYRDVGEFAGVIAEIDELATLGHLKISSENTGKTVEERHGERVEEIGREEREIDDQAKRKRVRTQTWIR